MRDQRPEAGSASMARNERAGDIGKPIRLAVIITLLAVALVAPVAPVRAAAMIYTVTTTDDTPANASCTVTGCTLRQAINASNLNDPGAGNQNSIQFASGVNGTILLLSDGLHGALFVGKDVAIVGPTGGTGITVSGNSAVRVFSIGIGVTANISNLTIAHGFAGF